MGEWIPTVAAACSLLAVLISASVAAWIWVWATPAAILRAASTASALSRDAVDRCDRLEAREGERREAYAAFVESIGTQIDQLETRRKSAAAAASKLERARKEAEDGAGGEIPTGHMSRAELRRFVAGGGR